jgi:hypothetical protein
MDEILLWNIKIWLMVFLSKSIQCSLPMPATSYLAPLEQLFSLIFLKFKLHILTTLCPPDFVLPPSMIYLKVRGLSRKWCTAVYSMCIIYLGFWMCKVHSKCSVIINLVLQTIQWLAILQFLFYWLRKWGTDKYVQGILFMWTWCLSLVPMLHV